MWKQQLPCRFNVNGMLSDTLLVQPKFIFKRKLKFLETTFLIIENQQLFKNVISLLKREANQKHTPYKHVVVSIINGTEKTETIKRHLQVIP